MHRGAAPRLGWALLALLAVCWLIVAQTAALSPNHSEDHSKHCCALCHLGHSVAALHAPSQQYVAPAAAFAAGIHLADSARCALVEVGACSTRGPPILNSSKTA